MQPAIPRQLRTLVTLYARGQRRQLAEQGLPQHASLLPMLRRLAPLSQTEFARIAGLDKSWASRVLERFVRDGLVERTVLESDRRAFELRLTPAGLARAREIDRVLDGYAQRLVARVPAGSRPAVGEALGALVDALQAGADDGRR